MRSDSLYLADILDAIKAIERFVAGFDRTLFVPSPLSIIKRLGLSSLATKVDLLKI